MVRRSSSRERKVRGKKTHASREEKRLRKHKKELARARRARGNPGQKSRSSPNDVRRVQSGFDGTEFVETEEVEAIKDRARRWLDVPRPVHLVGPTGCGKTALALSIAAERDRPAVWINGDESLETADLVGERSGKERYSERDNYVTGVLKKTEIVRDRWVDNPLSLAVAEGATLVYNEFSRTKPIANNVLLSVFEEGVLERPGQRGRDRTIDVHPEFRAILTSNATEYAGVFDPQDALLDRLIGVHMDFYGFDTEVEIVASHVEGLERDEIERIVGIVRELRDDLEVSVGTRPAIMIAEGALAFPEDAFVDVCTDVLGSKVSSHSELTEVRARVEELA